MLIAFLILYSLVNQTVDGRFAERGYRILMAQGAPCSATRYGLRASISNVCVLRNSLDFRYTLEFVKCGAPWVLKPMAATVTISYFDVKRQLISRDKKWFAIETAFANKQKTSMTTPVVASVPAKARFFSVELTGFSLATGQIALPLQQTNR